MSGKRILVLTLSFGAGHVRAAQTVAAELKRRMPEAEIRLVDALENCTIFFRAFYVWTYWAMIRYAPRVWKKFFESRAERKDEFTAPVRMWRSGCRRVFAEIEEFQPNLIVAAEVGAGEIAVIARRDNLTNAAIVSVITDFETEPIWVKPEISAFAVATLEVKEQLENWGAEAEKIFVSGIPIDADFAEKHCPHATRRAFDLDERPIVLLMGGGMGPTAMDEIARLLLQSASNLNIIALPGGDRRTAARLKILPNAATVSLRVLSWTNEVARLMQAASILATKPGGLTLAEAAACSIPLVLFDSIPGPEEENAARFVAAGAAVFARNSKEAAAEILRLLQNQNELSRMAASSQKLARADAAGLIADLIAEKIKRQPEREIAFAESKRIEDYRRAFSLRREIDEKDVLSGSKI